MRRYLNGWRASHTTCGCGGIFQQDRPTMASHLAVVLIDDATLAYLARAFTNDSPRWPFSHFYYGILVRELKQQGASVVGFDVFFSQPDDLPRFSVKRGGTNVMISGQQFFASRLRSVGNVVLGMGGPKTDSRAEQLPVLQLATNALALAHCSGRFAVDGVLRNIALQQAGLTGTRWPLGLVLAAHRLGLDLNRAEVTGEHLTLPGTSGVSRVIPLAPGETMYIDWAVYPLWRQSLRQPPSRTLQVVKFEDVLRSAQQREQGGVPYELGVSNKLMVVGAGGTGVNVYDRGPTALEARALLCAAHLNVAHAVLANRFVHRLSLGAEQAMIVGLAVLATLAGWRMKSFWSSLTVAGLAVVYVAVAFWTFAEHRCLLPLAVPVIGALLATHLAVSVGRTVEHRDRRRLEGLLQKIVAPRVMESLLAETIAVPAPRRMDVTVVVINLRGFTPFTEAAQTQAEQAARNLRFDPVAARALADAAARDAWESVNRYLNVAADEIKATGGTLDKYLGDGVLALWGAPQPDERHAAQALRCCAALQQAFAALNRENAADNERRTRENEQRALSQLPPLPLRPLFTAGIGVASGPAVVGFLGSEQHLSNYTAFGHNVNVAGRLEALARSGQIVLTEQTMMLAARSDAALAPRCERRSSLVLSGVEKEIILYDLNWQSGTPDHPA